MSIVRAFAKCVEGFVLAVEVMIPPKDEVTTLSLEHDIKSMIITELKLEDVQPDQIQDTDPLFGEGLGLDSLDAVELVLLLQKHYKIEIKDMEEARDAFASIRALADYIRARQPQAS